MEARICIRETFSLRMRACPPRASALPLQWREIGTSRWQLSDKATPFPAQAEAGLRTAGLLDSSWTAGLLVSGARGRPTESGYQPTLMEAARVGGPEPRMQCESLVPARTR